jgi:hypothetical protein
LQTNVVATPAPATTAAPDAPSPGFVVDPPAGSTLDFDAWCLLLTAELRAPLTMVVRVWNELAPVSRTTR